MHFKRGHSSAGLSSVAEQLNIFSTVNRTNDVVCSATDTSGHYSAQPPTTVSRTIAMIEDVWAREDVFVAPSVTAANTAATVLVLLGSVFFSDGGGGLGNIQMLFCHVVTLYVSRRNCIR